jgi:hypothetical protein
MSLSGHQTAVLWEYRCLGPAYEPSASELGQKLRKFGKKMIALAGFDDYYKSFTCKD